MFHSRCSEMKLDAMSRVKMKDLRTASGSATTRDEMSVTVERSEYYRVRYVIQNNIDYHSRTLSLTEDGEAVGFIVVGERDGGDEGNDVRLELLTRTKQSVRGYFQ